MNKGTLLWMIVFAISALCFFVVAAVVSVRGFSDLMKLLRSSRLDGNVDRRADENQSSH